MQITLRRPISQLCIIDTIQVLEVRFPEKAFLNGKSSKSTLDYHVTYFNTFSRWLSQTMSRYRNSFSLITHQRSIFNCNLICHGLHRIKLKHKSTIVGGANGEKWGKLPIVKCFPHKILSPFFPIFPHFSPSLCRFSTIFQSFPHCFFKMLYSHWQSCRLHFGLLSPIFPIFIPIFYYFSSFLHCVFMQ